MSGPLEIAFVVTRADSVRAAVNDVRFTSQRAIFAVRVAFVMAFAAFAVLAGVAVTRGPAVGCPPRPAEAQLPTIAAFLTLLALGWLAWPFFFRLLPGEQQRLTVLDEGFVLRGPWSTLSIAWPLVRRFVRTSRDMVFVLDAAAISVPIGTLPPWTVEAVARRHASAAAALGTPAPNAASGDVAVTPYRALPRDEGEEGDATSVEDAGPEDWRAPAGYEHAILARPSFGDFAAGATSLQRTSLVLPVVLLALAAFTAATFDARFLAFGMLPAGIALVAVGSLVLDFLPVLLARRDRYVTERAAGVLYAFAKAGFYMRSAHLERRDTWRTVASVRVTRRGLVLATWSGVHVLPRRAFATDAELRELEALVRQRMADAAAG